MNTVSPTTGRIRIVITGAPASAKSTIIERLKQEPEFSGFIFFDELARQLLGETPEWRNDWPKFHQEIYHRQRKRENEIAGKSFISDRGTIDAFAFMLETMQRVSTTLEAEYARYDLVLQLGSAAGLGEQFYMQDDIRQETLEASLTIEHNLKRVWGGHPFYRFIPAVSDIEQKYIQVRNEISQRLVGHRVFNQSEYSLHEHKGY